MHSDHRSYASFATPGRVEKSINSLLGLVEGIGIDGHINDTEIGFLNLWIQDHSDVQTRHPFNELVPVLSKALGDGVLSEDERADLTWLCESLKSSNYYNQTTADLQRLHGLLGAIAADGEITQEELQGLSDWLAEHDHLRTCWPYDEVDSLVTAVLRDKKIDPAEHKMLMEFFGEFTAVLDNTTIVNPPSSDGVTVSGICAVCPEIRFDGATFCLTGASNNYTRKAFTDLIVGLGGQVSNGVSNGVDYLIIGAAGNPCWAFACYGRKVEKAVQLRKQGAALLIVHETDFLDAVAER